MTPGAAYTPGAIGDAPAAGHRYWPQLDGMRTLAVALVLVGHSWVRHFHGAERGVGLFFALSGFLITGLLMDELGRHGRVDLARFTGRRALRLVPALLVLLAAAVPVLRPPRAGTSPRRSSTTPTGGGPPAMTWETSGTYGPSQSRNSSI
ncbi:hypothetical protein M3D71_000855 [Micrococcus luteus]|nr:hypothetical protein [Micrococcus luteus]MCV7519384.1 hypothetical protein [Micrococcus luteus]